MGHQELTSEKKLPASEIWHKLMERFNVFHLHKPYYNKSEDKKNVTQWSQILSPERILHMNTPKAVVDVMLGAIALTSGSRTLATYVDDMKTRGQDEARI